ncbi:hypothetical protein EVAR_33441_1 [Eumeta japonica]|uniref:Uncharacterized protein n=1 Tax=Eumeta variegata TaxID=151549 RepID=A0A4C1W383_EUMVA|nr:hypothetical protein EVAR_33441_1 [Eumeta japonica]
MLYLLSSKSYTWRIHPKRPHAGERRRLRTKAAAGKTTTTINRAAATALTGPLSLTIADANKFLLFVIYSLIMLTLETCLHPANDRSMEGAIHGRYCRSARCVEGEAAGPGARPARMVRFLIERDSKQAGDLNERGAADAAEKRSSKLRALRRERPTRNKKVFSFFRETLSFQEFVFRHKRPHRSQENVAISRGDGAESFAASDSRRGGVNAPLPRDVTAHSSTSDARHILSDSLRVSKDPIPALPGSGGRSADSGATHARAQSPHRPPVVYARRRRARPQYGRARRSVYALCRMREYSANISQIRTRTLILERAAPRPGAR